MYQQFLLKLTIAAGIMVCSAARSEAQGIHAQQLLSGGTNCHHVIRMIQRYGVNNSFDTAGSGFVSHHSQIGLMSIPDSEFGDLEVMQVSQVQHADSACGPKFNVTIRNNSTRKVCNFHTSVVAVLGRICPASPNATVKVCEICPGEAIEVCVQLPIEALAMGNRNGQVIGFQRLVVAIDSFDELVETNEANNVKAFACGEIPTVPVVVEQSTETTVVTSTSTVEQQAPLASPGATGRTAVPNAVGAAPVETTPTQTDPLRSAIRMIDNASNESAGSS